MAEPVLPADEVAEPKVLDVNELAVALSAVRLNGSGLSARLVYDSHESLRATVARHEEENRQLRKALHDGALDFGREQSKRFEMAATVARLRTALERIVADDVYAHTLSGLAQFRANTLATARAALDATTAEECNGVGVVLVAGRCSTCGDDVAIDDAGLAMPHPPGVRFTGPDAGRQVVEWLTDASTGPAPEPTRTPQG